jgi:protein disulfide-isomerase A1
MFKKFDEGYASFKGDLTSEDEVTKFIQKQSIPLMDEIGPDNYMRYYESKVPLLFFFWSDKESHRKKLGVTVEKALKTFRSKAKEGDVDLNAVYIDANVYAAHSERLNLEKDKWPAMVIHDTDKDLKYTFSGKDFTEDSIVSFISDFSKGVLKPKYKSEPAPEKNDGPVIEVVHDTFTKIVGDNSKDVLLEIYTHWCGFCKKLAPTYEKIAAAYAKAKGGDKVVIAKMDGSKNDIPKEYGFKLEGFPTIILYKANSAKNGVKEATFFEGDNSEGEIVKFLNENLTNKVTIDLPAEEEAVKEEL